MRYGGGGGGGGGGYWVQNGKNKDGHQHKQDKLWQRKKKTSIVTRTLPITTRAMVMAGVVMAGVVILGWR